MKETLMNKFQRAADPMSGLGWESNLYRDGIFFVVGATNLWVAQGKARDPNRYHDLQITGPSRAYVIGKLSELLAGFRLVQRGRTAAELVHEEAEKAKSEIAAAKKAAAEAPKPTPMPQIFGLDYDSEEARLLVQRELAAFVAMHAQDSNWTLSEWNLQQLLRHMDMRLENGEFSAPTAERFQESYEWLSANSHWEGKWRKRGEPAARPYRPQPVAPKPTEQDLVEQQRAVALEERRKLQQMPFQDLQRLYEKEKGRTRKAAFAVNR
jgi:hypothetical protein